VSLSPSQFTSEDNHGATHCPPAGVSRHQKDA